MMTGRRWRSCFGVGAVLVVLATAGASAALAVTANFEFDPPTFDFGPVPYAAGPTEPREFTLTNTGEVQLAIKNWRSQWGSFWPDAPNPFEVTSYNCHPLEPGESCSFSVAFDPIHPGIWNGRETVRSQIEEEPWTELELTGEGTGPWIPVTPNRVAFESVAVGMTTPPQTITLESQGHESFTLENISFTPVAPWSPLSNPFHIVGGSCHEGESLAPGKTCTIEVVMTPTVSGLFQSELQITDTAPGSPQSVELEGTATAAPPDGLLTSRPTATTQTARVKRACPKGRRKAIKKGRRICVKRRRHRRAAVRDDGVDDRAGGASRVCGAGGRREGSGPDADLRGPFEDDRHCGR